jgi:hypothetical protein
MRSTARWARSERPTTRRRPLPDEDAHADGREEPGGDADEDADEAEAGARRISSQRLVLQQIRPHSLPRSRSRPQPPRLWCQPLLLLPPLLLSLVRQPRPSFPLFLHHLPLLSVVRHQRRPPFQFLHHHPLPPLLLQQSFNHHPSLL